MQDNPREMPFEFFDVTADIGYRAYGDTLNHAFENAGLAIAALRTAKPFAIPAAAFEAGMTKADWPARLQRLGQGPLVELAPSGSELWLDGGHNPDGGRAVAAALADLEERVSRPLILVVGMLASKDCEGFLRNFAGLARRLIAVPVPGAEVPPARCCHTLPKWRPARLLPARPRTGAGQACSG